MSESLDLRSIQALDDLQTALSHFASGVQEAMRGADGEIRRTIEWLSERVNYWQREVEQARRAVAQATESLRRCEASGFQDQDGHYHQPDCTAQARALARAEAHFADCEQALQLAKSWRSRVEQSVQEYQREARRLEDVASNHTDKARSQLGSLSAKYEAAQASASSIVGVVAVAAAGLVANSVGASQATATAMAPAGVSWAEKRSILQKIDDGQTLTREEFEKLKRPISDLRAETIQPDYAWVSQIIEAQRFRDATQGMWTGEMPTANWTSVAWSLLGVAADTLKTVQFWRNKE